MKRYNSLIRTNGKFEYLPVIAENKSVAKDLVEKTYKDFKRAVMVPNYVVISVWEEKQ